MKLHVTELTIGDWVSYCGRIVKVVSLYTNGASEEVGWTDGKSGSILFGTGVEPIPITEKFLAQNFEKKVMYGIYEDYYDFEIREYSDGIYIANYHNCEMDLPDESVTISYVHELQHFLRHCRICKTFEL